jgi:hypothetical protein
MRPELFTTYSDPIAAVGPALRQLNETGVGSFLMHLPYTSPEQYEAFAAQLPLIPIYKDEVLAVYDMTQPRPWQFQAPIALSGGTDLLEATVTLDNTAVILTVDLLTQLRTMAGVGEVCELVLGEETAVSFPTILTDPNAIWQVDDLAQVQIDLPLPEDVPDGSYPILLRCLNGETAALPDWLFSSEGRYRLVGQPINVWLGEAIQLANVRHWFKGSQLHLSLHWLVEAAPQQELKLFVHVLDEHGVLVRQLDTIPCSWRCPTSQWQAGQTITDDAMLDLWGLSPGSYQIGFGLYDANSGERLPIVLGGGTAVADDTYFLPESITITSKQH